MFVPLGYAQANLFFTGAALPLGAQVTLGFKIPVGMEADPNDLANLIVAAYDDVGMDALHCTDANMTMVLVKYGPNDVGPAAAASASVMGSGGAGGSAAPAILMKKTTAFGGRSGRGRSFWPGIPESQINPGGGVDPSASSAWFLRLTDFFAFLLAEGVEHVLLHSAELAPYPVIAISVDNRAATQRRRQRH